MQKRIKFASQSTKQLKFETYLLILPRTSLPQHPKRGLDWHTTSTPVGPRACNLSSTAHRNHVGVQQPAKGPQLHVGTGAVSLAIPIDVLPLTLANWMDHHLVLPALSRCSQEKASQPAKIELVTSYKNESK
jgi:hypothetical protein